MNRERVPEDLRSDGVRWAAYHGYSTEYFAMEVPD